MHASSGIRSTKSRKWQLCLNIVVLYPLRLDYFLKILIKIIRQLWTFEYRHVRYSDPHSCFSSYISGQPCGCGHTPGLRPNLGCGGQQEVECPRRPLSQGRGLGLERRQFKFRISWPTDPAKRYSNPSTPTGPKAWGSSARSVRPQVVTRQLLPGKIVTLVHQHLRTVVFWTTSAPWAFI